MKVWSLIERLFARRRKRQRLQFHRNAAGNCIVFETKLETRLFLSASAISDLAVEDVDRNKVDNSLLSANKAFDNDEVTEQSGALTDLDRPFDYLMSGNVFHIGSSDILTMSGNRTPGHLSSEFFFAQDLGFENLNRPVVSAALVSSDASSSQNVVTSAASSERPGDFSVNDFVLSVRPDVADADASRHNILESADEQDRYSTVDLSFRDTQSTIEAELNVRTLLHSGMPSRESLTGAAPVTFSSGEFDVNAEIIVNEEHRSGAVDTFYSVASSSRRAFDDVEEYAGSSSTRGTTIAAPAFAESNQAEKGGGRYAALIHGQHSLDDQDLSAALLDLNASGWIVARAQTQRLVTEPVMASEFALPIVATELVDMDAAGLTDWLTGQLRQKEREPTSQSGKVEEAPDVQTDAAQSSSNRELQRQQHEFARLEFVAGLQYVLIYLSDQPPEPPEVSGIRLQLRFDCIPRGPPISDTLSASEFARLDANATQLSQLRFSIAPRGPSVASAR